MKEKSTAGLPEVGDLFVYTWGHGQTNVDAFQVSRVTEKSMWLRPVNVAEVPGTSGFMCCHVVPVKDGFIGGREIRVARVDSFAFKYGLCRRHEAGKTHYMSWYN